MSRDFIDAMIAEERSCFATIAGISGAGFALEAAREHMKRRIAELEAIRGKPREISAYIDRCNRRDADWQAIWKAPDEDRSRLRAEFAARWESEKPCPQPSDEGRNPTPVVETQKVRNEAGLLQAAWARLTRALENLVFSKD